MPNIEVLKFGSSVLRSPTDLPIAVDEIYRRWRAGHRVLAVVSAFEGVTDQLIQEAADLFGDDSPEATAAYIATGEQRTAALLTGMLARSGIPARKVEPREISLLAHGSPLESAPFRLRVSALDEFWRATPILVLPGFYGIDSAAANPTGYKLIARARRTTDGIAASVAPESPPPDSFLGRAHGAENRIEIELTNGDVIELRGQGAGRWPTTVAVMADLHEAARRIRHAATAARREELPQPPILSVAAHARVT